MYQVVSACNSASIQLDLRGGDGGEWVRRWYLPLPLFLGGFRMKRSDRLRQSGMTHVSDVQVRGMNPVKVGPVGGTRGQVRMTRKTPQRPARGPGR